MHDAEYAVTGITLTFIEHGVRSPASNDVSVLGTKSSALPSLPFCVVPMSFIPSNAERAFPDDRTAEPCSAF